MIPHAQVNNMLHIINKSFSESDALASCVKHALSNSVILLYENAVLSAVKGAPGSDSLQQASTTCKIYALLPDIEARGIALCLIDGIEKINYEDFVELVIQYKQVQPWI
jgi:tRNA 2-thiouridine synthesizing protein B